MTKTRWETPRFGARRTPTQRHRPPRDQITRLGSRRNQNNIHVYRSVCRLPAQLDSCAIRPSNRPVTSNYAPQQGKYNYCTVVDLITKNQPLSQPRYAPFASRCAPFTPHRCAPALRRYLRAALRAPRRRPAAASSSAPCCSATAPHRPTLPLRSGRVVSLLITDVGAEN